MKTIYLAGGCFWGTEHFMAMLDGVVSTEVGYANSIVPNPDYKLVCTGVTKAAETVKVNYDPARTSLQELLSLFFMTIDPTSVNRQGGDCGTQYRTGIYFTDPADEPTIREALAQLQAKYDKPLAVEVMPLRNFYAAEEYHQDYLTKNPDGYCHISPELMAFAASHSKTKSN